VNRVDFTTGDVFTDGGWFVGRPRVQLRQNGQWVDATAQVVSPAYPGDVTAGAHRTYTITFRPAEGDGVRVIGASGGNRTFTSVSEVAVRYAAQVADGGFEGPATGPSAWAFEGTAAHGVDRGLGFAHSGVSNGWIRTFGTGWSALTGPDVHVRGVGSVFAQPQRRKFRPATGAGWAARHSVRPASAPPPTTPISRSRSPSRTAPMP